MKTSSVIYRSGNKRVLKRNALFARLRSNRFLMTKAIVKVEPLKDSEIPNLTMQKMEIGKTLFDLPKFKSMQENSFNQGL